MCLAAFHSKGYSMTEEEFDNASSSNSDGVGFAYYSHKNNIVIEKGTNRFEMKEKYLARVEKHGERSPFMVHFRLATHGSVCDNNCHPFRINENDVMIHNGILPVVYAKGEKRTDTQVFADEYLAKLPENWFDDDYMFDMVEEYCSGSKLVIMTNNPKAKYGVYIVNAKDGSWESENNRWFSNSSHKDNWLNYKNWGKPSMQQSMAQDLLLKNITDEDEDVTERCDMCGKMEVYEEVCYECGTCQRCYNDTTSDCKCWDSYDINAMSEQDFNIQHGGL
jgi:glutamine amidotransferase